jgi:type III pantothenate kinase
MEHHLMLLCDIGNTTLNFCDDSRTWRVPAEGFDPDSVTGRVCYISVNARLDALLAARDNWVDLRGCIDWSRYYETMGVDRVVACEALEEGVIVDAGSAVTVDVVRNGRFEGGFIYPGIRAMGRAYAEISPRLEYSFNFELDLDKMPKNSRDAVSYGYLRTLYGEVVRHGGPIILTGGDAERFAPLFPSATVDRELIFKGMKKILENRC